MTEIPQESTAAKLPLREGYLAAGWRGDMAVAESHRYIVGMSRSIVRRVAVFMLTLSLGLGMALHGTQVAGMSIKMATAATSDMSMPNDCNGCPGDDGMTASACFAICGGVVAMLPTVLPVTLAVASAASEIAVPDRAGRDGPPDPYPPRSAVLS